MIIAANEVERGVDNLWKQGQSESLKPHANFRQFIPKNYFKTFKHAFLYLRSDKKYWIMEKKDVPWDMILGFIGNYNKVCRNLVQVIYLVLDELMSAWKPKTSKTGGLPNITFKLHKPKDLGTMIRDGVKCKTGIFVNHDIVQTIEEQDHKKFLCKESSIAKKGRKKCTCC